MYTTDDNVNVVASRPFFNLIKLIYLRAYPSLKPQILFYINGLAIWHGLPDIKHIKGNYGRPVKFHKPQKAIGAGALG